MLKTLIKFADSLLPQTQTQMADVTSGFKEDPSLEQRREEAKRKMNEEWGRKTLAQGGDFSLHNRVLNQDRYGRPMHG